MTVKPPAPPPLSSEFDRLLRRLRLPYVRKAAPEVIAKANAQRWEYAEVLRVLLAEQAAGRDEATIRIRRRASGLHHRGAGQLPTRASDRRQRGEAPDLNPAAPTWWREKMATSGEKSWPRLARKDGRSWGETDGR